MLTPEEIQALRAPFPLSLHSVREGYRNDSKTKIRWFVYVDRSDVQDLLDKIFPGEWATAEPHLYTLGKTISATVGITIRGVTRWDGGDDESGEGAKGALTNGFRRAAAYGWGVARYCYDIDIQIWTDSYPKGDWKAMNDRKAEALNQFTTWYKRVFGNQPQSLNAPATPPASAQKPANSAVVNVGTKTTEMSVKTQSGANPDEITWAYDRNALRTAIANLPIGRNHSSNERDNTIDKLYSEGAFSVVGSIEGATALVVNRLQQHEAKRKSA